MDHLFLVPEYVRPPRKQRLQYHVWLCLPQGPAPVSRDFSRGEPWGAIGRGLNTGKGLGCSGRSVFFLADKGQLHILQMPPHKVPTPQEQRAEHTNMLGLPVSPSSVGSPRALGLFTVLPMPSVPWFLWPPTYGLPPPDPAEHHACTVWLPSPASLQTSH